MNQYRNVKWMSLAASALIALTLTNTARAEGCTQTGTPQASTVVNMKGVYSCADIQGRTQVMGTYSLNIDGSVNWSSNGQRVTEVLVAGTAGGQTCEYVYSNGATAGQNLGYLKSTGTYQNVQSVTLCTDNAPPPPKNNIPRCEDLNASGGLDGLQIICPASGAKSVVYNLEIGQPHFSTTGSPIACVCNAPALPECDPSKPAGEPGACVAVTGSKVGTEVTTHIEINNDPYTCITRAGRRTCSCIDADTSTPDICD